MFESLECRQFLSVTPTADLAPSAETSSAITVPVDDTAEDTADKRRPKKKPALVAPVMISIIAVLIS